MEEELKMIAARIASKCAETAWAWDGLIKDVSASISDEWHPGLPARKEFLHRKEIISPSANLPSGERTRRA
jgi:hypothetical protein